MLLRSDFKIAIRVSYGCAREPVTPCIDVYKAKIQSDGSLDRLKLRIVVRGYLQNKELVGDTWSPTASMRTLPRTRRLWIKNSQVHGPRWTSNMFVK